jgi:glycerol-3-phosphate acyltransferase PlsY
MDWWIFAIVGYVCGSIPYGLLLTRAAGMGDVRDIGSGNIGATNVLRTGNKKIAALTLLCDVLKGFVPVVVATAFGDVLSPTAAGFGALAGHIFPLWLRFKGGKGVATGLGVLFGWAWVLGTVFVAAWVATFFITRISSASALIAALLTIPAAYVIAQTTAGNILVWPVTLLALIIWLTHRANIARLTKGEEPKSRFSRKP